jgi:hypothetical protein
MGISSKLENSDSRMIQLPSSGGLNFEASDQLDQSSFWFSLVQLILSKFLSNFKVSVIWDHSSFWFNLVQLIQILLVQLTQILYTNPFGAAYIFGSLYFRCSLIDQAAYTSMQLILSEGVFNRSGLLTRTRGGSIRSGWVRSIYCLYILCVYVVEGSYEGCMFEVKFVQLGYMIIC